VCFADIWQHLTLSILDHFQNGDQQKTSNTDDECVSKYQLQRPSQKNSLHFRHAYKLHTSQRQPSTRTGEFTMAATGRARRPGPGCARNYIFDVWTLPQKAWSKGKRRLWHLTVCLWRFCLVYQPLSGQAHDYLADDCRLVSKTGRRALRSANVMTCRPTVPWTQNSYCDRSFAAAGSRLWNNMPPSLRRESSCEQFKRQLKTLLFGLWKHGALWQFDM